MSKYLGLFRISITTNQFLLLTLIGYVSYNNISFFSLLCDVKLIEERPLQSKNIKAVMYSVDCGATTMKNVNVAIVSIDSEFDPKNQPAVFVSETDQNYLVHWDGADNLIIELPTSHTIHTKMTVYAGTKILYK